MFWVGVVRRSCRKFGMREVGDDEDWMLYWCDTSVALHRVMEMKKYQVRSISWQYLSTQSIEFLIYTCESKCYRTVFSSIPSQLAFVPTFYSNIAYILFMRSSFLERICSCALSELQKFVHGTYFPASMLLLNIKKLTTTVFHFLTIVYKYELTELITFLFICLISSFRSTVVLLKINYTCSICSHEFHWRKCCEAQLRLCVD